MFRIAAISLSVLSLLTLSAPAQHEHAEHLMKCAKMCHDCARQCDSCFKHCLMLTADGKKEHAKTAQFCVDCGDCCKTCAALCARNSPLAAHMLDCCAKCCDDCAASCESHPQDKHMAECAKTCRDCAKECRNMIKHLGK
jgi:hypothetical protein